MKDDNFEKAIRAIGEKRLPSCPGNMEANVFRRIRQIQSEEENVWSWLELLIPKTTFIVTALVFAIFTSSLVTAVSVSSYAADSNRKLEVTRALGFETISSSNLLASNQK
jgi:hypothetical protein